MTQRSSLLPFLLISLLLHGVVIGGFRSLEGGAGEGTTAGTGPGADLISGLRIRGSTGTSVEDATADSDAGGNAEAYALAESLVSLADPAREQTEKPAEVAAESVGISLSPPAKREASHGSQPTGTSAPRPSSKPLKREARLQRSEVDSGSKGKASGPKPTLPPVASAAKTPAIRQAESMLQASPVRASKLASAPSQMGDGSGAGQSVGANTVTDHSGAGGSSPGAFGDTGLDLGPLMSSLRAAVERNKRYPMLARRRGHQGSSEISFKLSPSGRIDAIRVTDSSRHASLDRAAMQAIERSSPLAGAGSYLEAPREFRLRIAFVLE